MARKKKLTDPQKALFEKIAPLISGSVNAKTGEILKSIADMRSFDGSFNALLHKGWILPLNDKYYEYYVNREDVPEVPIKESTKSPKAERTYEPNRRNNGQNQRVTGCNPLLQNEGEAEDLQEEIDSLEDQIGDEDIGGACPACGNYERDDADDGLSCRDEYHEIQEEFIPPTKKTATMKPITENTPTPIGFWKFDKMRWDSPEWNYFARQDSSLPFEPYAKKFRTHFDNMTSDRKGYHEKTIHEDGYKFILRKVTSREATMHVYDISGNVQASKEVMNTVKPKTKAMKSSKSIKIQNAQKLLSGRIPNAINTDTIRKGGDLFGMKVLTFSVTGGREPTYKILFATGSTTYEKTYIAKGITIENQHIFYIEEDEGEGPTTSIASGKHESTRANIRTWVDENIHGMCMDDTTDHGRVISEVGHGSSVSNYGISSHAEGVMKGVLTENETWCFDKPEDVEAFIDQVIDTLDTPGKTNRANPKHTKEYLENLVERHMENEQDCELLSMVCDQMSTPTGKEKIRNEVVRLLLNEGMTDIEGALVHIEEALQTAMLSENESSGPKYFKAHAWMKGKQSLRRDPTMPGTYYVTTKGGHHITTEMQMNHPTNLTGGEDGSGSWIDFEKSQDWREEE